MLFRPESKLPIFPGISPVHCKADMFMFLFVFVSRSMLYFGGGGGWGELSAMGLTSRGKFIFLPYSMRTRDRVGLALRFGTSPWGHSPS